MNEEQNPYAPPEAETTVMSSTEAGVELASRGARLAAVLLDSVLIMVVTVPILFLMGVFGGAEEPVRELTLTENIVLAIVGIGWYFILNGYLLATNGQTVGKKLLDIKIVRKNGEKISFGRIVGLRMAPFWAIAYVPFLGGIISLIDALLIFRESRYCLHDDVADSMVIRDPRR